MFKAKFYISDKEIVQDVGLRVFILEKILTSAYIRSGLPENLPDGRVVVLLEGNNKEKVLEFAEKLKREIQSEFGNPHTVKFSEITEDPSIELPDVLRSANALQMQQFSKGIDFLKPLPDKIEKSMNGFGNKLDSFGSKLDGFGSKLDGLPKKIATELKKVLTENRSTSLS